ncbi:MAG: hypothetical protein FJ044_02325, partial [Candidatus Cloacimonetes bacterium]|nr:hypothetical protein [Candidatus Cloacimonadota bacterium]
MSTSTYWWMKGFWGTRLLGKTLGQWFVLIIIVCFSLAFWKMGSVSSMDVFWAWATFALTILALTFPGPVTFPIRVIRNVYLKKVRPLQVPAKPPNLLKTLGIAAVGGFLVWFVVPTWFAPPLDRYVTYGCIALGIVAVTTIALTHLEETAGGKKPWLTKDRLNQVQAVTSEGIIQTSEGKKVVLAIVHGKMSGAREALAPEDKLSFLSSALLVAASAEHWKGGVISFVVSTGGLPTDPGVFDGADSSFVRAQADLLKRESRQKVLLLSYDPEIEDKLGSYLRKVGLQLVRLRQNEVLAFLGEVINGDVFLESAVREKGVTVASLLPDQLSFGNVAQFGSNFLGVIAVVVRNGKEIAQAEEAAQGAGAKLFLTMVAP